MSDNLSKKSSIPYLASFIIPVTALAGNLLGGYYAAMTIVIALGIFPILDHFSGEEKEFQEFNGSDTPFQLILIGHALLNPLLIISLVLLGRDSGFTTTFWLAGFSTGIACGLSGIVVGHELGHTKPRSGTWWLARMNLAFALYLHFTTEHNRNHHKWNATEKDPACAPKGRGLWLHFLMTVPGQFLSAWKIEEIRAGKRGKSTSFFANPIFKGLLLEVGLLAAVWYFFSNIGLIAIVYPALISIFLLEYVNYIQHYGLRRQIDERENEMHSWSTERRLSRWVLFELARHPAHHLSASIPYWKLKPYRDGVFLPSGYFGLFWVSLIPPLWKRVMDKRLPSDSV